MKSKFAYCLIALASAGCSPIGPDYERPVADLPANWKALPGANSALWKEAQPADALPKSAWWKAFKDETLDKLEEACLENNFTLRTSLARLDQAIAQSDARSSSLLPSFQMGLIGSRTLISADRPLNNYDATNYATVQNDFRPVVVMNYEVDWLGKIRRDVEASRDTAEQAAADTENVRLLLSAQVASAYFLLRQFDEEIRVLTEVVGLQEKLLTIFKTRYDEGAATRTELSQQTALTQSSGAQLELLKGQRNVQENLLATLTGTPAATFSIAPGRLPETMPAFPVAVPSELLERRPDIASAERAMAAANAQIGVAKAAYFPSLLVAPSFVGYDSANIANLLSVPSLIWSIGLTATQVLFDGGRTSANVRFAQAGYTGTVSTYRQSILVAIQETQDAMSAVQQLDRARAKQDEAVNNLNRALQTSYVRYREGLDNALALTLIQQNQLTALRTKWQIHGGQFLANVSLVKALGGGWDGLKLPAPTTPPTAADIETLSLKSGS